MYYLYCAVTTMKFCMEKILEPLLLCWAEKIAAYRFKMLRTNNQWQNIYLSDSLLLLTLVCLHELSKSASKTLRNLKTDTM